EAGGWRLDGQKQFITNARYAPFAIVLARVGDVDPKRTAAGITAFVVPLDAPGVSIGRPERKLGLRASDTSALVMEAAAVDGDARDARRRADSRRQRLHAGLCGRALRTRWPRDDDLRRDKRDTAHRDRALAARGMTIQKAASKKQRWLDDVYGAATKKHPER